MIRKCRRTAFFFVTMLKVLVWLVVLTLLIVLLHSLLKKCKQQLEKVAQMFLW